MHFDCQQFNEDKMLVSCDFESKPDFVSHF